MTRVNVGDSVQIHVMDIGWHWKEAVVTKICLGNGDNAPSGQEYGFLADFSERRLGTALVRNCEEGTVWRLAS
jgi:hypothetical protein